MEIRPTFFSITGFLIPGIVFVTAILFEFKTSRDWLFSQMELQTKATGDSTAIGIVITVTAIAIAMSVCFVVGSVVTEISQRLYIKGRRKEWLFKLLPISTVNDSKNINDRTREIVKNLLKKATLKDLVGSDLDAREIIAYQQTCGLDLHWFAGRNLMLGGSGLSCVIAGIVAFCQFLASCLCVYLLVGAGLITFGFMAMWIAAYRKARFEEYTAKVATVALLNSNSKPPTGEAST